MIEKQAEAYAEIVSELTAAGAPFALREVTVEGRPCRVYANAPDRLVDIFAEVEERFAERDMLDDPDGLRLTYGEVFERAGRLAAALTDLGVQAGDRLGIAMRNRAEWFVAFLAAVRIGAVATLLNSRGAAREMSVAADQVGCRLVIAEPRCAERLAEGGASARVIGLEEMSALIAKAGPPPPPAEVGPDDPAAILFTSGTTGRAKGATLTQRNLCNMAYTLRFVGLAGRAFAARQMGVPLETLLAGAAPPSVLMIMPLFHISGVTNFIMAAQSGGLMSLMPRWDPAQAADLIERNKVSAVAGPGLVISDLLDQPNAAERLQSLQSLVVGGQATPPALRDRIAREFPRASSGGGWGMTETCGAAVGGPPALIKAFAGASGAPLPVFDIKVAGPDGKELPFGEIGEFWVRGASVMRGYWEDAEANAASFSDGWLRTGDLGHMNPHGFIFIVDRQKDMIISAGENIYCAEVEAAMGEMEPLIEVALIGLPDERLGERAVAVVTPRPGASVTAEEVQAHVRQRLADYKVPSEVVLDLGALPRNVVGKVDKPALRKLYLASSRSQQDASVGAPA